MRNLLVIGMLLLVIPSCFEEDMLVQPHEQGGLEVGSAAQGPFYARQVFYDLNANREASSNEVSEWDLSFGSSTDDWLIRLNSSKFMYAGNSFDTTFIAEITEAGLEMRFDKSDGNPDSTAMGAWYVSSEDSIRPQRYVYLVDRGRDGQNRKVGLIKVQFDIRGEDYLVRYANTDNSGETTIVIPRDEAKDRIYFSFDDGTVDVVPGPEEWSLLFSRYTTMLQTDVGEDYPYLVTGVLLNPNGVAAVMDTIHEFSGIELADTIDLNLTTRADVIGYDWKYYNFDAGIYTIVPDFIYVIRDRDGFYYKLRFIDFYSDTGEKGHPSFEYIRL